MVPDVSHRQHTDGCERLSGKCARCLSFYSFEAQAACKEGHFSFKNKIGRWKHLVIV